MINIFLNIYTLVKNVRLRRMLIKLIEKWEGGQMYSPTIRTIYKSIHNIEIGYGSYGGCFSLSNIPPNVTFGNYCSIAQNIKIFRANHPKKTFTTHPILYNPVAGYVTRDILERPALNIGHDVWIGEQAIILPNVKLIGNGAIIGAGSIVTKDVAPYTIMAGNPARIIGHRFTNDIAEKIENTKWWTLKKVELFRNIEELNKLVNDTPVK